MSGDLRIILRAHELQMVNRRSIDRGGPRTVPLELSIYLSHWDAEGIDADAIATMLLEGRFHLDIVVEERDSNGVHATKQTIRYLTAPPTNVRFEHTRSTDG